MNALPTNIVEFKLPKKPKVKEKEPLPDQRKVAIVPIRAVTDRRLHEAGLRLLMTICSYSNRAGITWVGGARLAKDLGITKQAISKQFKHLVELGYIEVMRKGWKGHQNQTMRVIFDPTIDAETAIAVTSRTEDTRPHYMKEKQQQEQDNTIDPEGLKRIQDMIRGVVKPITEPAKEYVMPKGKDTATVAKMKAQIKAKKASHSQPLEVDNGEPHHSQPHSQPHGKPPEVDQNVEERMYKEVLSKVLKVNLMNVEVLKMLVGTMQVNELETVAKQLAERYQAEGIAIPTSEMMLADDLINLSAENLLRTHGV
jgi:biotin operon repressor